MIFYHKSQRKSLYIPTCRYWKTIHFVADVMAIKISTAFIVLVWPVTLAENGYIGYNYRAPVFPLEMTTNLRPNIQQQYFNNGPELQHGFVPSPAYNQYSGDLHRNQQAQHKFHHNNQAYQTQPSHYNGNYNGLTSSVGNVNIIRAQNHQEYSTRSPYTNTQPQQPVITKHIYFHLPPDDTNDVAPVTTAPPKKTYNIIFIKLPSQKSAHAARIQQIIHQQAAESKTLIYVLVKKPETQHIQTVTSKPEVFFVKYKEPRNVPQPIENGLVQMPQSIPGLLPGQINGHGVQ